MHYFKLALSDFYYFFFVVREINVRRPHKEDNPAKNTSQVALVPSFLR